MGNVRRLVLCAVIYSFTISAVCGGLSEGLSHDGGLMSNESGISVQVIEENPPQVGWNPFSIQPDVAIEPICNNGVSSINDFPDDLFTQEQRQNGAILLHIFAAFYFFTVLAVVCNDYFLPSVECICEDLKISPDVAAATFMAVSGAIPEFFTNIMSTFVTESQMGLGAVIGTLFFNTLGVAACAGMASIKPVQLLWYPLARDCVIFSINVTTLTIMIWDGEIQWYEALILSVMYIVYWIVLFQNERIRKFVHHYIEGKWHCCRLTSYDLEVAKEKPGPERKGHDLPVSPRFSFFEDSSLTRRNIRLEFSTVQSKADSEAAQAAAGAATGADTETMKPGKSLWVMRKTSIFARIWWLYTWPIRALTTCLIPSPKTSRKWYPLSFIMCIVFIGCNSYLIFWMMSVIGFTLGIPDIVMGFTILCWGSCLPEAIACIIVIRKGSGGVGVSNSLGSNSMAILFSLGVPWLLRTAVDGAWTTGATVNVYSHGINYITMLILLAVLSLFVILATFRYRLKKTAGLVLLLAYGVFLTISLLMELNIILPSDTAC